MADVVGTPDGKAKMKQGAGKRLNDKQRVEIIQLSENSKISKRQLADKYGVSEAAIRKLLLKKDDFLQRYYDTPEEIRDQRLRGKSMRISHEHLGSVYVAGGVGTLATQGTLGAGGGGHLSAAAAAGANGKSMYPQDEPWKQGLNVLSGKVSPFMKSFVVSKPQRDAAVSAVVAPQAQPPTATSDVLVEEAAVAAAESGGPEDLEGVPSLAPEEPVPSQVDWLGFSRMLRDIRRGLHHYPETAYQEFRTQAFIRRFCETSLRIPGKNVRVLAGTGLVVDVCYENATIAPNDKRKLPVLAFRADMDALPIEELNDHLPYCSTQKKTRKEVRKRKKRKTSNSSQLKTPTTATTDDVTLAGDDHLAAGSMDVDAAAPADDDMDLSVDLSGEIDDHDDGASTPAAHMCGHDGHMTMVLGLLALVVRQSHLLPQDTFVRFIFQPAEEGPGGAEKMIQEGVLEDVDEVYGLHNYPFPLYSIHVRPGPVMAHEVEFWIDIIGVGGHGSAPQNCVDPILAGAMVVQALQSIVSRSLSPTETAVVSVTQFVGGDTNNVIPGKVQMAGTIRDFDLAVAEKIKLRMEQIVHSTCLAAGATAQVTFKESYPPVVNHYEETRLVQQVAIDTGLFVSEDGLPLMASEDFSFYLREKKGCFFFLGTKEAEDNEKTRMLHSNEFDFNDKAIPLGIRVFLGVLQSRLQCQLLNVEDLQDFQVAMERIVG